MGLQKILPRETQSLWKLRIMIQSSNQCYQVRKPQFQALFDVPSTSHPPWNLLGQPGDNMLLTSIQNEEQPGWRQMKHSSSIHFTRVTLCHKLPCFFWCWEHVGDETSCMRVTLLSSNDPLVGYLISSVQQEYCSTPIGISMRLSDLDFSG